jgi:hypothetical protein
VAEVAVEVDPVGVGSAVGGEAVRVDGGDRPEVDVAEPVGVALAQPLDDLDPLMLVAVIEPTMSTWWLAVGSPRRLATMG